MEAFRLPKVKVTILGERESTDLLKNIPKEMCKSLWGRLLTEQSKLAPKCRFVRVEGRRLSTGCENKSPNIKYCKRHK